MDHHLTTDDPPFSPPVRSATPLDGPNVPFLRPRGSLSSSVTGIGTGTGMDQDLGSHYVLRSDSHSPLAPVKYEQNDGHYPRERGAVPRGPVKPNYRRWLLFAVLAALIIIAAVVLGVYFGVVRRNKSTSSPSHPAHSQSSSRPSSTARPPTAGAVIYGVNGTEVTTEGGSTFTYINPFGGYFVHDPSNPFNNDARAQSYTPPLNRSWDWSTDQVYGVNLGGWLVLEPFITPALYEKYRTAVDEWTLSTAMAADTGPGGGIGQLEDHYRTFITEEDFAQIAGAGLNWIRLPIPFWAIDVWNDEPFLAGVCWKYALKAFDWARKYGLRIMLDLHATPGSQNAYNHSGQVGKVNLLRGVMGIANAQRLLHYIRIFTEFISQPEYRDVIVIFGLANEPTGMPETPLFQFYVEAHRMIRNITGVGAGNGPYISVQGGNVDLPTFTGADRIAVEQHPYFAFGGTSTDITSYVNQPCDAWAPLMVTSWRTFGVTTAGEWSLAFNDCGYFLRNSADDHSTTGCALWDVWEDYTPTMKRNLMNFAMAHMDSLHHWFFWTWKVLPSSVSGAIRTPFWSYKLGLDNGWIPTDPRTANGYCARSGTAIESFDGAYLPWQTGGADAGTLAPDVIASYGRWPPTSIGLVATASVLPTYTPTGPVPTLPTQTYAAIPTYTLPPNFDGGDGWLNPSDTARGMTEVAGCTYPNPWDATAAPIPIAACTGT